jgi:hypothetical protein
MEPFFDLNSLTEFGLWASVKMRINNTLDKYVKLLDIPSDKIDDFTSLSLALAKYDCKDCLGNWHPKYNHEETIFKWAKWSLENNEPEAMNVIEEYNTGQIPDCFVLLIDYFD